MKFEIFDVMTLDLETLTTNGAACPAHSCLTHTVSILSVCKCV